MGRSERRAHSGPRLGTLLVGGAVVAVAARIPTLGDYSAYVLAVVFVSVIAALSLNLLMGYAGQVSLGQAALVGTGAYAVYQYQDFGFPFPLDYLAGVVTTVAFATVIGLPSLRIRGLQLAALTLAFGIAAERVLFARPWDERSTAGVVVARPAVLGDDRTLLAVVLVAFVGIVLLDSAVRRSRIGRAFYAVRDREENAAAWGISVGRTKLLAYAISGLYAGVAGGLYALVVERLTPTPFDVWKSLGYVAAVVIGGAGSMTGVIVAAAVLTGAPELFRSTARYTPLGGAVLLMLLPVLRPDGLSWLLDRRLPIPSMVRRRVRRTLDPATMASPTPSPPATSPSPAATALGQPHRVLSLSVPIRTLLAASEVQVHFRGLQVFSDLSLEVERGELVGLIGPNGAGKTTFFNVVSGFVPMQAGRIHYRGRDLAALPAVERAPLGISRSFQHAGLCPPLSVWENTLVAQHPLAGYDVGAALLRTPSVRHTERALAVRAEAALDAVGLRDLADEPVGTLPYGKQRLTEVAALLAAGPELLLLDEPAAGLDPEEADELGRILRRLHADLGLTVLMIEHHLPLVAELCSYVYVLADGGVLAHGDPASVQANPDVVSIYVGSTPASRGAADPGLVDLLSEEVLAHG